MKSEDVMFTLEQAKIKANTIIKQRNIIKMKTLNNRKKQYQKFN